jgi:hypothetical protein
VVRVEDIVYSPSGRVVHYVFNPDHYIGIVIANTTLLYKSGYYVIKFISDLPQVGGLMNMDAYVTKCIE